MAIAKKNLLRSKKRQNANERIRLVEKRLEAAALYHASRGYFEFGSSCLLDLRSLIKKCVQQLTSEKKIGDEKAITVAEAHLISIVNHMMSLAVKGNTHFLGGWTANVLSRCVVAHL